MLSLKAFSLVQQPSSKAHSHDTAAVMDHDRVSNNRMTPGTANFESTAFQAEFAAALALEEEKQKKQVHQTAEFKRKRTLRRIRISMHADIPSHSPSQRSRSSCSSPTTPYAGRLSSSCASSSRQVSSHAPWATHTLVSPQ